MKSKKMIFASVTLVILVALGFWLKGCMAVDGCLDSGGRWNYETKTCEH
jgi:hypothetical protein